MVCGMSVCVCVAMAKITLELGQLHSCFKTAQRKTRRKILLLWALDLTSKGAIHVALYAIGWDCVTKSFNCVHMWATMKLEPRDLKCCGD